MKEKTDKSFGVIPIKKTANGWQVLLIHQFSKIGNNSYWVFPKGHAEGSETPLESAQRELLEETGLQAQRILANPVFSLGYSFVFDDEKVIKTVDFYLGLMAEGEMVTLQAEEVKEAKWCSLDEAYEQLDYADTKKMFAEVMTFLQEHSDEIQ